VEFFSGKLERNRSADHAAANDNHVCYLHAIILAKRAARCLEVEKSNLRMLERIDQLDGKKPGFLG